MDSPTFRLSTSIGAPGGLGEKGVAGEKGRGVCVWVWGGGRSFGNRRKVPLLQRLRRNLRVIGEEMREIDEISQKFVELPRGRLWVGLIA